MGQLRPVISAYVYMGKVLFNGQELIRAYVSLFYCHANLRLIAMFVNNCLIFIFYLRSVSGPVPDP